MEVVDRMVQQLELEKAIGNDSENSSEPFFDGDRAQPAHIKTRVVEPPGPS